MRLLPRQTPLRYLAIVGYALFALALVLLVAIAAFPIGMFRKTVETRLSQRFDREVTIGALERRDRFSLTPIIAIRDLHIPQAPWAGNGDLARVDRIEVHLPILPLIAGRFEPREVTLSGGRVALVRSADGKRNWRDEQQSGNRGEPLGIERLTITDTNLSYRDEKQDRRITARIEADARGLRMAGRGDVRGAAVRLAFAGAPLVRASNTPWPFFARLSGDDLAFTARGTMARALDTNRMSLDITARAADLKLIDAVIEAGLFRTQPVRRLSAHIERTPDRWAITNLDGQIGRSPFRGELTVDKSGERTRIDGSVNAGQLDFDDLASDDAIAQSAALERRIGPRLVPNTRIDISKIDSTDGRFAFRVGRILSREGPTAFRTAQGTLTLEDRILTVDPLTVTLAKGRLFGTLRIDQRGGPPSPLATLDLRFREGSLALLGGGPLPIDGRLDARIRLTGRGDTLRQAIAASDGRLGLVARDGSLPKRYAVALGFDLGRAVFTDSDERAALRCIVADVRVRRGRGQVSNFVVDTSQSQMTGTGTVAFPDERIAATLTGAPKRNAILRVPGSVQVRGTLLEPDVVVPEGVRSARNILRAIGNAIGGDNTPRATDANCRALEAQALG
ncbi:AsmA family protein [Sphingomonas sp.]